jgi:hypothetical protein
MHGGIFIHEEVLVKLNRASREERRYTWTVIKHIGEDFSRSGALPAEARPIEGSIGQYIYPFKCVPATSKKGWRARFRQLISPSSPGNILYIALKCDIKERRIQITDFGFLLDLMLEKAGGRRRM